MSKVESMDAQFIAFKLKSDFDFEFSIGKSQRPRLFIRFKGLPQ